MKKFYLCFSFIISSFFISGAFLELPLYGDGILKNEKRSVKSFNKININGTLDISLICQKQTLINIQGDNNIIPFVKTYVDKGILNITTTKKYKESQPLKIQINNPDINSIKIQGTTKLNIQQVKNQQLDIQSKGNSTLNIKGQSKKMSIDSEGSGYIDTKNLKAEEVKVNLKGFSIIDVFASKNLNANISGFGKINYYGNPKNVSKNISGTGFINQAK